MPFLLILSDVLYKVIHPNNIETIINGHLKICGEKRASVKYLQKNNNKPHKIVYLKGL